MSVTILGIFVADVAFRATRQPAMGETILGEDFRLGPGGKGSNQAVAAAMAGGRVTFLSTIGADDFGAIAKATWARAGVTPRVRELADTGTGAAYIFVSSQTGDNAIIVYPGAAGTITAADVEAEAAAIQGARVFMTQLEQPVAAALRGLQIARDAGVTTILNPAPAAVLPPEIYPLCDYLTPNESEAAALTGLPVTSLPEAQAAADALLALGVGVAVVTLGAEGVLLRGRGIDTHVPSFRVGAVVDTTGAGDAFNGGFATALAEGADPVAAARFGCAVAGISVTRSGTAPSMPTRAEVDALLKGA